MHGNLMRCWTQKFFTQNILKGYTLGQLIFYHDMILPIKNNAQCEKSYKAEKKYYNNNYKNMKILYYD